MLKEWTASITRLFANRWVRVVAVVLYYSAILLWLVQLASWVDKMPQ